MSDPLTGYIRVIAICVFRNGNRILVGDGYDPTKGEVFYRPPGGRIEIRRRLGCLSDVVNGLA
jgi:hypothetical protein